MNLSGPAFTLIITLAGGFGAIVVALISSISGKQNRRTDAVDKLTSSTERLLDRSDKDIARIEAKADKCEARLGVTERQLSDALDESARHKVVLRVLLAAYRSTTNPVWKSHSQQPKSCYRQQEV